MQQKTDKMKKVIAIATGGFVWIGYVSLDTNTHLVLTEAFNIRKFGTTRGLGQIAVEGPTSDTVLDACGVVEINRTALIATILCTYEDDQS